jgi:hypothetical protein
MPDRVIKRVNAIGLREKQGRTFWFLNRRQEPYEWTDTILEDDPKFQGLLEDKEEAAYPDISAEFPGVELESKEVNYAAVTDEPVPNFEQLAATALDNAGIDPQDRLRAARAAAGRTGPTLVEANDDEIVTRLLSICRTQVEMKETLFLMTPQHPTPTGVIRYLIWPTRLSRLQLIDVIQINLARVWSGISPTTPTHQE